MTPAGNGRAQVMAVLAAALALPPAILDSGQSFLDLGVDSVAVVDALFTLEEQLGITIDFNAAGAEASGMEGPINQLIDRIAGMVPAAKA